MAIPAFGGASAAAAAGTTSCSPAIPAGVATGDLMLACIEYGNSGTVTCTAQGGGNWQLAGSSPAEAFSGTIAGTAIFYDYYNGSQTDPTFAPSNANHIEARIIYITGARSADGPNFGGASADLGDTDLDTTCTLVSGFSTTDADCLIVLVAGSNDSSPTFGATWTNANLANIAVRVSDKTNLGNDGSVEAVTGELATAGAVGTFTNTMTAANAWAAGLVLAIRPEDSAVSLVIADATHAHAADNLALTQHNVLAINDATHGHTADNVVLVPNLIVADALHAHTADNLSLTQHNVLAVADATHGHTADNQALTQHNILAIADATHGHAADNQALTQHNILVVADAAHAHTADNVVLDTNESVDLEIADAAHAHTADALVLGVGLVIADAAHAHSAESLTLTQHNVLAIDDALHEHTAEHIGDLGGEFDTGDGQAFYRLRRHRGMGTRVTRSDPL